MLLHGWYPVGSVYILVWKGGGGWVHVMIDSSARALVELFAAVVLSESLRAQRKDFLKHSVHILY